MMDRYGTAVVEERTQGKLAELREYIKLEYGLGTEPEALLLDAADGAPRAPSRVRQPLRRAVRALV